MNSSPVVITFLGAKQTKEFSRLGINIVYDVPHLKANNVYFIPISNSHAKAGQKILPSWLPAGYIPFLL